MNCFYSGCVKDVPDFLVTLDSPARADSCAFPNRPAYQFLRNSTSSTLNIQTSPLAPPPRSFRLLFQTPLIMPPSAVPPSVSCLLVSFGLTCVANSAGQTPCSRHASTLPPRNTPESLTPARPAMPSSKAGQTLATTTKNQKNGANKS
jgi:hypothetical protein